MEPWYPVVIGSVIFFYIHSFIRTMRLYLDSGKTLTLTHVFQPVADMFTQTH
jgi:hypothetical protein